MATELTDDLTMPVPGELARAARRRRPMQTFDQPTEDVNRDAVSPAVARLADQRESGEPGYLLGESLVRS